MRSSSGLELSVMSKKLGSTPTTSGAKRRRVAFGAMVGGYGSRISGVAEHRFDLADDAIGERSHGVVGSGRRVAPA